MKYHVFIATTQGVVAIQDIISLDDIDIQSLITVNGTATLANISYQYHHFVKKGSGIIEQDFGCCSYRINIEQGIDQGSSWQLAVYLAHVFAQYNLLGNGNVKADDQVIIATGQVNTANRTILAVNKVAEKYHHIVEQYPLFLSSFTPEDTTKNTKKENAHSHSINSPIFFIPDANSNDIVVDSTALSYQKSTLIIESCSHVDSLNMRIHALMKEQGHDLDAANKALLNSKPKITPASEPLSNVSFEIAALNELERLIDNEKDNRAVDELEQQCQKERTEIEGVSIDKTTEKTEKNTVIQNTKIEKGSSLKKYRNSLDETKEVENSLAGLMAPFNPKHIILRVVGFCGFTLFVIALILTFIKNQQSEYQPSVANKQTEVSLEKTQKLSLQEHPNSPYILSQHKQNGRCSASETSELIKHTALKQHVFKAINRQQLCQLLLNTNYQVNEVIWLDNNKQGLHLLEHINEEQHHTAGVNEKSWRIPLPEKQANDISYFFVIHYQEQNKSDNGANINHEAILKNKRESELFKALTHFVKEDVQGLKLTYQDLSTFVKQQSGVLEIYQHTLEVY